MTHKEAVYILNQAKQYLDGRLDHILATKNVKTSVFEERYMKVENGGIPLDQQTFRKFLRFVSLSERGISSIELTSETEEELVYTIYFTDDTTYDMVVKNGKNGIDGKSAYEAARQAGFDGTEEEFNELLASIKDIKPIWGNIIGDIEDQEDLMNALASKMDNVTLADVATSGSYNDLTDKPTINGNLIVHITQTGPDSYSTDKTSAEIISAYEEDGCVILHFSGIEFKHTAIVKAIDMCMFSNVSISGDGTAQEIIFTIIGSSVSWSVRTIISAEGKQDQLVSGENIVTVNGQSLLGSGNIEIQGGGGDALVIKDWTA